MAHSQGNPRGRGGGRGRGRGRGGRGGPVGFGQVPMGQANLNAAAQTFVPRGGPTGLGTVPRGPAAMMRGRGGGIGQGGTQSSSVFCITCTQNGHHWTQCTSRCGHCNGIHNGEPCDVGRAFNLYPEREVSYARRMNALGIANRTLRELTDRLSNLQARNQFLAFMEDAHYQRLGLQNPDLAQGAAAAPVVPTAGAAAAPTSVLPEQNVGGGVGTTTAAVVTAEATVDVAKVLASGFQARQCPADLHGKKRDNWKQKEKKRKKKWIADWETAEAARLANGDGGEGDEPSQSQQGEQDAHMEDRQSHEPGKTVENGATVEEAADPTQQPSEAMDRLADRLDTTLQAERQDLVMENADAVAPVIPEFAPFPPETQEVQDVDAEALQLPLPEEDDTWERLNLRPIPWEQPVEEERLNASMEDTELFESEENLEYMEAERLSLAQGFTAESALLRNLFQETEQEEDIDFDVRSDGEEEGGARLDPEEDHRVYAEWLDEHARF